MKRIACHVILPAMMPILFFAVALTPVEVLGCFLRGFIALVIAFISGLAALGAAIVGAKGGAKGGVEEGSKGRAGHDKNALWWGISTLVLVVPVVALIIMA
ncbi:MAG: hypothetical protein ACE144_14345 [Thermodesulfobacteriota bacterium]